MIFNDSYEKIKKNFELLEAYKEKQRQVNLIELFFIIFSIIIMIPYEMLDSFYWLRIVGGLNLACDIIFVILLYRLFIAYKKGIASVFLVTTDIMAALPGIGAIIVFLYSYYNNSFNANEFLAAAGLSLPALKTTKFLRILRITRLFRIVRNFKLLKFISLKSDSLACENAVAWLGFIVLIFLIITNFLFIMFGPLTKQENKYFSQLNDLKNFLNEKEATKIELAEVIIKKSIFKNNLIYIKDNATNEIKFFGQFEKYNNNIKLALQKVNYKFCSLNSSKINYQNIEILFDDGEIFHLNKTNNFIWISIIISFILLFSFFATIFIGKYLTDYLNDYRKIIIDSYQGVESSFDLDLNKLSKNDRDSFAYAMGLYTQDFVRLVKGIDELEQKLKQKETEIEDLNYTIKQLENDLQQCGSSAATQQSDEYTENLKSDLEKAITLIKKLLANKPDLIEKIKKAIKFKTINF
ncbi:MAG TPA: hypothetical protein PLD27_07415 [bacterium]|nr:hypothetical protein [bacterium]